MSDGPAHIAARADTAEGGRSGSSGGKIVCSSIWKLLVMADADQAQDNPAANAMNVPKYADELPAGCPRGGATDATGTFYATHRSSTPDSNDFRTAAGRNAFNGGNECKRRGNSVMASLDDAKQLCLAHPDVHVYVSEGVVEARHGKLLKDGSNRYSSHHTLWRYAGVTMHIIFSKVV